jgi:hypothetical protein
MMDHRMGGMTYEQFCHHQLYLYGRSFGSSIPSALCDVVSRLV